jgi:hypothetical protein
MNRRGVFRPTAPLRTPHREGVLLKGYVLLLAGGLLVRTGPFVGVLLAAVPLIPVCGYLVRVVAGAEGEELPPFGPLSGLLRDGARAAVVAVGYLSVPAVLLVVTFRGAAAAGPPESVGLVVVLRVYGGATMTLFVSSAAAFVYPAATAAALRAGRLRAALPGGRLRAACVDRHYFTGWVGAVGLFGVATAVLAALAALGPAGTLVGIGLWYYATLVAAAALGSAHARAVAD